MLIWLAVLILVSVIFFCTLGSAALQAIPLERLWKLRGGGGRNAAGVEYWITHSQQITWSFRVLSRISCVALALLLAALLGDRPLPPYVFFIALFVSGVLIAFPGSLIPAAWAQTAGEKIGLSLLPLIRIIGIFLAPITVVCHGGLNMALRLLKRPPLHFKPLPLRSELEQCMGGVERAGMLSEEEKKWVRRIFSFPEIVASEIMTPRVAMRCLSEQETGGRAIELVRAEHLSRIPIYRESPDNIVGVLLAKDLLARMGEAGAAEAKVGPLAREPFFVPEATTARALLAEMRKRQAHMAIVVDEYGVTTGIVTIENILESIVGEIKDEHDSREEKHYEKLADGVYRVDARLSVADAREELGIDVPERAEYDTLAGFICAFCGRVPAQGEVMEWGGYSFKVMEATKRGLITLEIRGVRK
jgi:CBS domain containing-hemolysin-like protein